MNKLTIAALSLVFACSQTFAQDAQKAGDVEIETHLDTYGYLPRVQAKSELERGEQVYVQWCAICHREGEGMAGTQVLGARYQGAVPALLEERTNLDESLLKISVREGIGSMPYFRKTEVSDEDFQALTTYLTRNNK